MQIYDSYIEAGQQLCAKDRREYYTALIEYLAYGVEPTPKGAGMAVITAIRPLLEESRRSYVNGRKGGRPRKPRTENAETQTAKTEKPKPGNAGNQNGQNAETQTAKTEKPKDKDKDKDKEPKSVSANAKNALSETLSGKPDDSPPKDAGKRGEEPPGFAEMRRQVIAHLNAVTGSHFRPNTKETSVKHLNARFREGYTVDDCKRVIDAKAAEWLGNPSMRQYLRPETLFCSHFEGYLNAAASVAGVSRYAEYD